MLLVTPTYTPYPPPPQTFPLYLCLVAIWLVTVFVPGRWIILGVGLLEFLSKFLPPSEGKAFAVKAGNLLASLPNDDDLEQTYREERREFMQQRGVERYGAVHAATLKGLLQSSWSGHVLFRADGGAVAAAGTQVGSKGGSYFDGIGGLFGWASQDTGAEAPSKSTKSGAADNAVYAASLNPLLGLGLGAEWREAFLVVQGRRLVWWGGEADLDAGRACQGQLLLYGHAGTTQASPVVAREVRVAMRC
jgi:hypothetical protein